MPFGPLTRDQWITRITCPDVRDAINTQLIINLANGSGAQITQLSEQSCVLPDLILTHFHGTGRMCLEKTGRINQINCIS